MEKFFQNSNMIEERDELMVSPTGSLKTHRKSHFLKPILSCKDSQSFKIPYINPKQKWPLQISFKGWPNAPEKRWKTWVKAMHSKYSLVWEKAGILEPIMCSILKITRNDAFLFSLVENWCSDTNTFMFPWGEATVTLEDVFILGGFSVLGDPVLLEYENDDKLVEIRGFLEKCRNSLRSLQKDELNVDWLYSFMDCGYDIEHEAFLCLWLLTCVFPGCNDKVYGAVFDLAVWLARGRRFALGPCVLASLYRDLGVLRGAMVELDSDGSEFTLWSPLFLVQVWAWERFPLLQPKPNVTERSNLRMKRWHGEKKRRRSRCVSESCVSSAGVSFLWRPYAIAVEGMSLPKFYVEKELVLRHEELSLEFESFFRCLRACVLVGVDCQEQYNPHRVAMQFGFDQDIPEMIPREHVSSEIGWYDYNKPLSGDEILYVPSRLFESDVSDLYSKWWRKSIFCPVSPFKDVVTGMRSDRKRREFTLIYRKQGHYADVFQDFVLQSPRNKTKISRNSCGIGKRNQDNDLDVPPGFEHINLDIPPGFEPINLDIPPGFEPMNLDIPPGFEPINLDIPPGFEPINLDIPPGFEAINLARTGSFNDNVVEAKPMVVANKFVGTAKEGFISTECANDVPPGFKHVPVSRFRSINDLVSETESKEVVVDAPPGFRTVRDANKEFISEKHVDDASPSFGSSTKSTVGKRKAKALSEFPQVKNRLDSENEKLSQRRFALANPNPIVKSISGVEYMNIILSKSRSGTNESKRLTNGAWSNFDVERVSEVEAEVSRMEREVAVLKSSKRRKKSDVSDIEARVALIKTRVTKIEEDLAALKNSADK